MFVAIFQVRNRSLINRNVIGDTGIHAVTTEIERLRSRLEERSNEFEHLKHTQLRESNENNSLKVRIILFYSSRVSCIFHNFNFYTASRPSLHGDVKSFLHFN